MHSTYFPVRKKGTPNGDVARKCQSVIRSSHKSISSSTKMTSKWLTQRFPCLGLAFSPVIRPMPKGHEFRNRKLHMSRVFRIMTSTVPYLVSTCISIWKQVVCSSERNWCPQVGMSGIASYPSLLCCIISCTAIGGSSFSYWRNPLGRAISNESLEHHLECQAEG